MIKKTLLSLFVGFVGLIGFSYGGWESYALNTTFNDPLGSQNRLAVVNKGNFLTSLGGVGKSVLFFGPGASSSNRGFMYWTLDKKLYSFSKYVNGSQQGEVRYMSFCDYFDSSLTTLPSNCSSIDYNVDIVSSYLGSLSNTDSFAVYTSYSNTQGNNAICFSNLSQNNSLCFCGGYSSYLGSSSYNIRCSLTNSKNYSTSTDFGSLSVDDLGTTPGAGGGNSGGGNNGGTISNGGNTYLCPTVGQLLATYGQEYNTGLCYSSNLLLQNGSITTVEPQSIFELFEDQSEFMSYRQLYGNYCSNSVSVSSDCQNAFAGKDLQYTLLAKIPGSIPSLNLYSYCNLALNQDPNTSTCVAEGVYNTGVSREDVINSIVDGDYQVIVPSTGSVADDVLGSGMELNGDFINTLQSIYTKFTSFFTTQSGNSNGIIPGYIISMLLVIILFKLFKK